MDNQRKAEKTINILAVLVIIIAAVCSVVPLISKGTIPEETVTSAFGQTVTLYGKGLYARNSESSAVQAIAQDLVTLIVVIPGMIVSLILVYKKHVLGRYILTGLFGYMLYTYMSYAFLMFYNELFLLYVAAMTISFYGLVMNICILQKDEVVAKLEKEMKTKGLRVFLIISGIAIFFMWSGRIFQSLLKGEVPEGLDNCTTLVIQAMDLGIIVPACFVIAYQLKHKIRLGYILGPVIIVKAVTLITAVVTMGIFQIIAGVEANVAFLLVFGGIFVVSYIYLFLVLRQVVRISKK